MNKYVLKACHMRGYFSLRMENGFLSDFYSVSNILFALSVPPLTFN